MVDLNRDVAYIINNLLGKKQLSSDELDKAVLYSLYLKKPNDYTDSNISTTQKELNDIFPALQLYELEKANYRIFNDKEQLVDKTRNMLKEIIEFLTEFYKNCDIQEERDLFKKAFLIISNIK